jgi:hypothetical protein
MILVTQAASLLSLHTLATDTERTHIHTHALLLLGMTSFYSAP